MPDIALEREALALFEDALELPEETRESWLAERTAGHPELAARVAAMIAADRTASLRTGMAADQLDEEPPPEKIGAYRIVERIGRGGMGSVYLGERASGDFAHRAAIKVIKPGLLSEILVERFRRERQLLAGLTHPNIAQLYDGGETEAGSPYFVMEFVDGLPLLAWAEENRPSLATRQRLFRDICAAVAFAHRNLVVHRDLTPSNVLVTKDGVAKLIDFGIARPADDDQTAREAPSIGSLSLTPGYAAPERMTSAAVTTAADIYSLGKLLRKLIPPGQADRELDAIVERATADDPLGRYPTADALGADIAAWSGSFPVAAMNGGKGYAVGKFVRRHRIGVAAATISLLLLVGTFGMTVVANARAEAARNDAERRFEQTRAIAKSLLFEAYDQVSRVPGSTNARAYLARTGLDYLEVLAADETAPIDVRVEAGSGYLRLAQVVGGGQASQLGRYEDANALLARSNQILAPMLRASPDDPLVRRAAAALLIEQSAVNLYNNNDVDRARRQSRYAQHLLQPDHAATLETARLNADAMRGEGDSFLWAEDYPRARAIHLAADRYIAGLPPVMQRDPRMMSIRAQNLRLLGEAHHELEQVVEARAVLDRSVDTNRAVLATQPDDPLYRRRVVTSLRYRAIVHRTNDRDLLARESIEEAREQARILRDRDPADSGALQLYAVVNEVYAQVLSDLGRHQDAYRIGGEIRDAYRIMVERAGNAPGQLRSLAMAMRSNAEVHYNGGDYAGACRIWSEVLEVITGLERRGALTDFDRNNALAQTRDFLARSCNPPRRGLGRTI